MDQKRPYTNPALRAQARGFQRPDSAQDGAGGQPWCYTRLAELFSQERAAAGRGRYILKRGDYELAEAAVELFAQERVPEVACLASIREFLGSDDPMAVERGYLFASWAYDPGAWLAAARRRFKAKRTSGHASKVKTWEKQAAPPPEELAEVIDRLRRRARAAVDDE